MVGQNVGNTQIDESKGETVMNPELDQEIQETLKKIDEYKQLIDDAENALDAAIENLEEALAEAYEEECAEE